MTLAEPAPGSAVLEMHVSDRKSDESPKNLPANENKELEEKLRSAAFTSEEKKNIVLFIAGIMCYKFAFETLGGSVSQFVLSRLVGTGGAVGSVTTLSILQIVYGFAQSIGSMLVAQLLRRFRVAHVLGASIWLFAALGAVYLILEAATGGTLTSYGTWNPYGIFGIYTSMGFCLGVLELVRRVIPRQIVGEDPIKLKRMDATVHIFYEIAGTAGAFTSTPLIKYLGPVYAVCILPPLFVAAGFFYWRIHSSHDREMEERRRMRTAGAANEDLSDAPQGLVAGTAWIFKKIGRGFVEYFATVKMGAKIVLTQRKFVWLMAGYVLPLTLHRIIENLLFPVFAKKVLLDGSLSGILLGGSNFGELCGALLVLRFTRFVKSPLPWVRVDGLMLVCLWVLAYAKPSEAIALACGLIPVMMVVSGAWAAGDVSLVAYIQSQLGATDEDDDDVTSPLGAVMGFLYASYLVMVTLLQFGLGLVLDEFSKRGDIQDGFFWISGVGLTVCGVVIVSSTFIPRGSLRFNPEPDTSGQHQDGKTAGTYVFATTEVVAQEKPGPAVIVPESAV